MILRRMSPAERYALANSSFCRMSDHSHDIEKAFNAGMEYKKENISLREEKLMQHGFRNGQIDALDAAIDCFSQIVDIKLWPDEIIEGLTSLKNIYLFPMPGEATMSIAGMFIPLKLPTKGAE